MSVNIMPYVGAVSAVYGFIVLWYNKLKPIIEPVVAECERLAIDGKIDKSDRKELAMKTLGLMQNTGLIKLNWIERFLLSHLVNFIAERLPDFVTDPVVKKSITQVLK